jgi:hypothetical protein
MNPVHLTARWLTVEESELDSEMTPSLDGKQTARFLELMERPGTRVLSSTRVMNYPGQRISSCGARMTSQVTGYEVSGDSFSPRWGWSLSGTGYEFRTVAQNAGQPAGLPDELLVEARLYLSNASPQTAVQDPLVLDRDRPRQISGRVSTMPGPVQSNADSQIIVDSTLHIPNGGAALMKYSVPEWLAGEPEDPAKRAGRALVLLVQAERRK